MHCVAGDHRRLGDLIRIGLSDDDCPSQRGARAFKPVDRRNHVGMRRVVQRDDEQHTGSFGGQHATVGLTETRRCHDHAV
jgi:hypothetical protein